MLLCENNCLVMQTVNGLNIHVLISEHCYFWVESSPGELRQKPLKEPTLLQHVISSFLFCYFCRDYKEANHIRCVMSTGAEWVLSCFHAFFFFFFNRASGNFQHPQKVSGKVSTVKNEYSKEASQDFSNWLLLGVPSLWQILRSHPVASFQLLKKRSTLNFSGTNIGYSRFFFFFYLVLYLPLFAGVFRSTIYPATPTATNQSDRSDSIFFPSGIKMKRKKR